MSKGLYVGFPGYRAEVITLVGDFSKNVKKMEEVIDF